MKRMLLTTLLSLATLGVAFADYQTDQQQFDLLHSDLQSGQMDARQLPPTAAGKREDQGMKMPPHFGTAQDHPEERYTRI